MSLIEGEVEEHKSPARAFGESEGLDFLDADFLVHSVDRLLQHVTDPVTLTVNDSPELDGSREITYDPIYSEASLRYLDWVHDRFPDRLEPAERERLDLIVRRSCEPFHRRPLRGDGWHAGEVRLRDGAETSGDR